MSISNWIFTACVACKNQFQSRLLQAKNSVCQTWFLQLDFWKSTGGGSGNTFLKSISVYRASKGDDVEVEDELDLYSYKWEHLTKAEQNNALHESYQFLIKKFISKEERKKMKEAKDAQAQAAMAVSAFGFGEAIDSKIDFSHLNN